jgi:selenocysteine-specific elongation factor
LDVRRGMVVLTKTDLVDDEWLALVTQEVSAALRGTSLAGASVVPVSAVTGAGLPQLVAALDSLLADAASRPDSGRPRLPIDRVFTMSGFGTVVTGTLVDGALRSGDELEVMPAGRRVRVRGLQRHNERVESVGPGNRVAANLAGAEKDELARGDVLAWPGAMQPVRRVDARVRVLPSAERPIRHGASLLLHTGTTEVGCRVIVLDGDEIVPGSEGWAQLYLDRPIAASAQDRFVLRVPSPATTIAGGVFVDVAPRRHARHDSAVRESLVSRAAGDVLAQELRKYPRGVTVAALLKATVAPEADVERLQARRVGEWLFSDEAWSSISTRAARELASYHGAFPLRAGMAREELRSRLGVAPASFPSVVQGLVEDGLVVERNGSLATPDHEVELSTGPGDELVRRLAESPSLPDAMRDSGATEELVRALVQRGDIVRVSPDVAFTRDGYEAAIATVREMVSANGSVTVAQLRDRMGASRRIVLALLEHLDAQRVTRRVGDSRILR